LSERMRKRYLAFRVVSEQSVNKRDVTDAVWNAVLRLFGEYGASQINLALIEYDQEKSWGIIHCSRRTVEMVRASIASITEINEKSVAIHVLGVSGTLKALRRKVSL
jgi:ribonuclease P/MRP protein subunit POP5